MDPRMRRVGVLAAATLAVALGSSQTARAQELTTWSLTTDHRKSSSEQPTVYEVLSSSMRLTGESRSSRAVPFELHALRVRDGRVIAEFHSKAFDAIPNSEVRIPRQALPAESWFGEGQPVDPQGFVEARKAVPGESAVTSAMDYIINGVFPDKPLDWKQRELVYLVVVPATGNSGREAVVINHEEQYSVVTNPLLVVYPAEGRDR